MEEDTRYTQLDLFSTHDDLSVLLEKVVSLEKECHRLRLENTELKGQLLSKVISPQPAPQASNLATEKSSYSSHSLKGKMMFSQCVGNLGMASLVIASGQEAPIVIYSMASSSSEDAPRGMSFLYSANRLNVAVSRAQCAAIIVASPKVFEAKCHTSVQIKLANAFSHYLESSTRISIDPVEDSSKEEVVTVLA